MPNPVRRPRLGLALSWFVAFWVAGDKPVLAAVFAAWTVYWALSERPALGLNWAAYGCVMTLFCITVAVRGRL